MLTLFIVLVDTISQDVRTELPWEQLYADDLAIFDITSTDTQHRLEHNRSGTGVRTLDVLHTILPLSYPYRIFAVTLLWVCMTKHSRNDAVK